MHYEEGESPVDHLQNVIYNYASAIGVKGKDANLHLQLGMVLEEKYYIEDMFGFKKEVPCLSEVFVYCLSEIFGQ